jgi:hypothetical protein
VRGVIVATGTIGAAEMLLRSCWCRIGRVKTRYKARPGARGKPTKHCRNRIGHSSGTIEDFPMLSLENRA